MNNLIVDRFNESIQVKQAISKDKALVDHIYSLSVRIAAILQSGGKIVLCGNGGSASDALHFAGEIVGRFIKERTPWPAVVLNSDVATMTAIANDYSYDEVFSRQAQAHLSSNDIFIGISTSGNSENIISAVEEARKKGVVTAALLGKGGGKLKDLVDYPVIVPSSNTARIQESHITIIHCICELVENLLTE